MKNRDSILKSRAIPLPVNLCTVKAMAFSISRGWMGELDHTEAEYQRTDAFELWCWTRLLRVT